MSTSFSQYLDIPRRESDYQPVLLRLSHFFEFVTHHDPGEYVEQAKRCMNCGIPFCHNYGCPLGNPVPEANALIAEGRWKEACDLFHAYNNFPEWTGRLCPAPCEASCVHEIHGDAVCIRQLELELVERGWKEGWITPYVSPIKTGRKVAIVGSGPAGLAAAQQLARAGHDVVVYEKAEKPGGILRYGIPDFKLEKPILDRRLSQLVEEGVLFQCGIEIGSDMSTHYLQKRYDAIVLTGGAMRPRDLKIPGRELNGIIYAMDYLVASNQAVSALSESRLNARGQRVVIIGGGDTGADCLGTAIRQKARDVVQIEILPKPPLTRSTTNPWPQWPNVLRTGTSHKEGGSRQWNTATKRFVGENGQVNALECVKVDWKQGKPVELPNSQFRIDADMVLLAMGFVHPIHDSLLKNLGVGLDSRGNVRTDSDTMMCDKPGIFAAGDMQSGASLVVRAIAGGRRAARGVDLYLMGETDLT